MPDTGIFHEPLNGRMKVVCADDPNTLRAWREWRAIEGAIGRMDDSEQRERLSHRQCELETAIETCCLSSPVATAARIDLALSLMGYDDFLADSPQNFLCAVLKSIASELPADMRAALSLAILPDQGNHHIGEMYVGKTGLAYLLTRYEEACRDLALYSSEGATNAALAPYHERRALTLNWIFRAEPTSLEEAALKLRAMIENIGDVVDRGSYFSDGFVQGLSRCLALLESSTSTDRSADTITEKLVA